MFNKQLLKRNDKKIKSMLTKRNGMIECSNTLFVLFPKRYETKGLANIDDTVEVFGVCLVVDKDYNYTVFKLPNLIRFSPIAIDMEEIDGKEYFKMEFKPPMFIESTQVIDNADPVFVMLEDWAAWANVPFFLTKDEVLQTITKSIDTTSTKFGTVLNRFSSLLAVIDRDETGSIETRHMKDIKVRKWVGLVDASSIYNNNFARIVGGYFNKGLAVGILKDKTEVTELEKVFRR